MLSRKHYIKIIKLFSSFVLHNMFQLLVKVVSLDSSWAGKLTGILYMDRELLANLLPFKMQTAHNTKLDSMDVVLVTFCIASVSCGGGVKKSNTMRVYSIYFMHLGKIQDKTQTLMSVILTES